MPRRKATVTSRYTQINRALLEGSRRAGVPPNAVRVLVALAERGGQSTSKEIAEDLADLSGENYGSTVRRSLLQLYGAGLAVGAGLDGGRVRRGVRTRVELTVNGYKLAGDVLLAAKGQAK